jgi:hypothetical protein
MARLLQTLVAQACVLGWRDGLGPRVEGWPWPSPPSYLMANRWWRPACCVWPLHPSDHRRIFVATLGPFSV